MTIWSKDSIRNSAPWMILAYHDIAGRIHMQRTKRRVLQLLRSGGPLWLDLGGGDSPRPGWLSVDLTPNCDVYWNLARGLPFPSASVDRIYSSHLLEHLTFEQGEDLLLECKRVLKPGGEISVCVPNAKLFVEAYLGSVSLPRHMFGGTDAYFETTAIDSLNYVAYMGEHHKYMFDQENLNHRLGAAGFVDVQARSFDYSIDLQSRRAESIYARGIAPPVSVESRDI